MKRKVRLEMENELLLTKTKAQIINMYLDEFEKNKLREQRLLKFEGLLYDNTMKLYEAINKEDNIDVKDIYYTKVHMLEWVIENYLDTLKENDK